MEGYRCYFTCTDEEDENPIYPMSIPAPAIGSLFFFEGEDHGYRVIDVQYQLRNSGSISQKLVMVNVIMKRIKGG